MQPKTTNAIEITAALVWMGSIVLAICSQAYRPWLEELFPPHPDVAVYAIFIVGQLLALALGVLSWKRVTGKAISVCALLSLAIALSVTA